MQHGVLVIGGILVAGRRGFRTAVVQGLDGRTAIVLNHGERVLELHAVPEQFIVHVTAHVGRHRPVPGHQDAGQVTGAGRFFRTVQQHRPRVLAVHRVRIVNAFVCTENKKKMKSIKHLDAKSDEKPERFSLRGDIRGLRPNLLGIFFFSLSHCLLYNVTVGQ